ncbi:LysR family transcriptional regulator [Moritella viscosa]
MIKINNNLLSGLATFTATASCNSFTQAAEKLHITTGAISQQIKQLEQNLKLTLFERHSRGIRKLIAMQVRCILNSPPLLHING